MPPKCRMEAGFGSQQCLTHVFAYDTVVAIHAARLEPAVANLQGKQRHQAGCCMVGGKQESGWMAWAHMSGTAALQCHSKACCTHTDWQPGTSGKVCQCM